VLVYGVEIENAFMWIDSNWISRRVLVYLDRCKHGMCLANYAHDNRTLLHCLRCILDLEDTPLGRAGLISWRIDSDIWGSPTRSLSRCHSCS
jgi:hypothetical protein